MSVFNVGFVIFPELTQLDFTGPQQVLARLPQSFFAPDVAETIIDADETIRPGVGVPD
jgi:hypothetical protein